MNHYDVKDAPLETRSITKEFYNFYTGEYETIDICYALWKGFKTESEARDRMRKLGWNPENYFYISVDGQINIVSMHNLGKQTVLNKSLFYRREGEYIWPLGFDGEEQFTTPDKATWADAIEDPKVGQRWTDELAKDLHNLFNIKITKGENVKRKGVLEENSVVLLGTTMFHTMVPVFKLGVMDLYMQDSPSRWKLWREGVSEYNYYTKQTKKAPVEELKKEREKLEKVKNQNENMMTV